ncbi:MAG TPA: endopeptidase La [Tissierellia bacterium]|nr:endopeptidase La [Tissierellia bacterium]
MDKKSIPLIPLRGLIIFPNMVLYFDVGREKSIQALEEAMLRDQLVFLTTQRDLEVEDPSPSDFYQIGTIAKIKQMLKLPGDAIRVLVEGQTRSKVESFVRTHDYFDVHYEELDGEVDEADIEAIALVRTIKETFQKYSSVSNKIPPEVVLSLQNIDDPGRFSDLIAPQLGISIDKKQELLEAVDIKDRLRKVYELLLQEIEIVEIEQDINEKVKNQINKLQKEYFLREQMKVIQQELGEDDEPSSDADKFMERLNSLRLRKDVHEKLEKEIKKFSRMNPSSPDSMVTRNYVEWILDLPWNKSTKDRIDLPHARKILDEDHYGLDKVKERVIEYLAIRKLTNSLKGPIICLVGPPGVGKTSIASSIARALNRKFIRMSLGGVRDEAEIRGHRRTYIGAIPGRIMTSIKEVKSKNPLFLFDEIDKLSSDFRGDPASALLEVLDPEQNKTFQDHYLEVPFDLSKVMFLTTANTTQTIPRPLLDRMEVIEITGYTVFEKEEIARRHLLPKQLKENGLEDYDVTISKEALLTIIEGYTRESGVRELERKLAQVLRKVAAIIVEEGKKSFSVTKKNLESFLGPIKYRQDERDEENHVGIATGLAWTSVGGETLKVEVNLMKGKGGLSLTGQLGDVMKESAQAGLSYIRAAADKFGVTADVFKDNDIHVHVPEGAIPKDGPSAGITMATAMTSALTGKPVRSNVAMTGEITLRGRVLPIGGLKEKILAASRYGIDTVIIPADNESDLADIPKQVLKGITVHPVKSMDEVLELVLIDEDQAA